MVTENKATKSEKKPSGTKQPYWLLYVALLLAGILLLAQAFGITQLQRSTAKLGIALVYAAFALLVGGGRPTAITAAALVWAAVIATYLL